MDELKQILEEIRPDIDFEKETSLIDDGVLDSFDIISIVGELNMTYDIEINVEDLLPENFNSMEAIYELVCKLQEE
ncbi:MAG: acyl carrier protein [Lachnospiraceae bacterium]|nr:acyl carrier protein [Lachnospiraceae bacterium]